MAYEDETIPMSATHALTRAIGVPVVEPVVARSLGRKLRSRTSTRLIWMVQQAACSSLIESARRRIVSPNAQNTTTRHIAMKGRSKPYVSSNRG